MTFCPHCSNNKISVRKQKNKKYFLCQKCSNQWSEKQAKKSK